jgi:hypothetical protein
MIAQHMRVVRREAERLRVARKRVLDAIELQQCIAAMTQRIRMIRRECQRGLEACECLGVAFELEQRRAVVEARGRGNSAWFRDCSARRHRPA